jgi:hypothetical protein
MWIDSAYATPRVRENTILRKSNTRQSRVGQQVELLGRNFGLQAWFSGAWRKAPENLAKSPRGPRPRGLTLPLVSLSSPTRD